MKFKVTQSSMKDFVEYTNGQLCGLQYVAKYFDGMEFPSTETMKLGQWFEFMATGAKTKFGHTPVAETTQKGELTAKYKVVAQQVANFNALMQHYGFRILAVAKKLETDTAAGDLDLIVELTKDLKMRIGGEFIELKAGDKAVLDLKCSGLLYDKWNEMGWDAEKLPEKERTMTQAVHYTWLYETVTGKRPHFFFAVFSNTNAIDHELFYIRLDEVRLTEHSTFVGNAHSRILADYERGFIPHPHYKTCGECPLKDGCKYAESIPGITLINY